MGETQTKEDRRRRQSVEDRRNVEKTVEERPRDDDAKNGDNTENPRRSRPIATLRLYSRSPSPPPEWKGKPKGVKEREKKQEISGEKLSEVLNPVVEEHLAARAELIDEQVSQMKKRREKEKKRKREKEKKD